MAVNDTNAKITSSEIVQLVEQFRTTVNRLELLNDCDVTEISFAYDSNSDTTVDATDDYWNASAPDECYVFGVDAGGITFPILPENVNDGSDVIFTAANFVVDLGSDAGDLLLVIPKVNLKVCDALNEKLGAPTTGGAPREEGSNFSVNQFTGSLPGSVGLSNMDGAMQGCFNATQVGGAAVGDEYYFYSVLIAR